MVKRGMPTHSVEAAKDWREKNLNPAKRKRTTQELAETNLESFDKARTREKIAEADKAEMQAAVMRGELVSASAVRSEFSKRATEVRDAMLNVPARLAPVLLACKTEREIQSLLDAELRSVLAQLVSL